MPGSRDHAATSLLLRAQRVGAGGDLVTWDFALPHGVPLRVGREPRKPAADPQYHPEYGADLVVRGDAQISKNHATVAWDGARLRVQRWPKARNPVYVLDAAGAETGRPADEFTLGLFDRFRIGNTTFTVLPDVQDGSTTDRTLGGEDVGGAVFSDPAPRLDALSALPNVIRHAPDDEQLRDELLDVVLRGTPRADVAAVVALGPDDAGVEVRGARWRDGAGRMLRAAVPLVRRAVRGYENAQQIWLPAGGAIVPPQPGPLGSASFDPTGWAACVPLVGSASEGLYVAGRLTPELAARSGPAGSPELVGDVKFARLAADIFAGLRELRGLQRREGVLAQFLTPVLRQALAGRSLDDVTARREATVTTLVCALRGPDGGADLLAPWDQMSAALEVMTEAVVEHEGVVGDIQGDVGMGFWGWPLPQDDQVERAGKAALAVRRKLVRFAARKGHPLVGFACGVGIAHGPAVAGRMGALDQMKIAITGPSVHRAARLEVATRPLRVPILVDEAAGARLAERGRPWCRVRRIARLALPGQATPVAVSELLPPEGEPGPNLSETNRRAYEAALDRFQAGDWEGFRRMAARFPPDGPLSTVVQFVESRATDGGPPPDWDGGIPLPLENPVR